MAGCDHAVVLPATPPSRHELAIGGDYCRQTAESSHSPWEATIAAHAAKSPCSRPEASSAAMSPVGHIGRLPLDHGYHDSRPQRLGRRRRTSMYRSNYMTETIGILFVNVSMLHCEHWGKHVYAIQCPKHVRRGSPGKYFDEILDEIDVSTRQEDCRCLRPDRGRPQPRLSVL